MVLVNLADWLRVTAILIKPFLPQTAETFYRAFNFEESRPGTTFLRRCGRSVASDGTASHGTLERRQARAAVSQGRSKMELAPYGQPGRMDRWRHAEETSDRREISPAAWPSLVHPRPISNPRGGPCVAFRAREVNAQTGASITAHPAYLTRL